MKRRWRTCLAAALAMLCLMLPWFSLAEAGVLSIINSAEGAEQPRMRAAIARWRQRYPEGEVLFRDLPDVPMLATAMQLGDPAIDLVGVQEYMGLCSRELYANGALTNLKQHAALDQELAQWISLESIIGQQGGVFGVPQALYPYFWSVNRELFQQLGLQVPQDGWRWSDFFALGEQLHQLNTAQGSHYKLIMDRAYPFLLNQYCMNRIDLGLGKADFDNAQFRSLMADWKKLSDRGLVQQGGDGFQGADLPPDVLIKVQPGQYSALREAPLILPPVADGMEGFPTVSMLLVLNKHSARQDMALHFLACYLSPAALLEEQLDVTGPLLKRQIEGASPEDLLWRSLLENGRQEFFDQAINRPVMVELFPQFMQGSMSVDQFAVAVQQAADNVFATKR